jgi:antitoxin VapB
MAFHVRDAETDTLVRKLAKVSGLGITEAIKTAVANEIQRRDAEIPLAEKLQPIWDRVRKWEKIETTQTDKEFWDDMCGDP